MTAMPRWSRYIRDHLQSKKKSFRASRCWLESLQPGYAEAERIYKRSLAIVDKAFGTKHSDVAVILNNLGLLYKNQVRYAEAEPLFKRSLAIREKIRIT